MSLSRIIYVSLARSLRKLQSIPRISSSVVANEMQVREKTEKQISNNFFFSPLL